MKNNKEDIYNTLVPSLKDRFFQQQLNFEEEQSEELPAGKKYFKYFAYAASLTIALGVFSYLAFTSYKYSSKPQSALDIPLVRKDLTPIRTIPEDPGGEKFSNQDKLIYNNILDNSAAKTESTDAEIRTPVEQTKPQQQIAKKTEEEKKIISNPITSKPTETKGEEPKKIPTKTKSKVAKQDKKIDNPFDILDHDVGSLDEKTMDN